MIRKGDFSKKAEKCLEKNFENQSKNFEKKLVQLKKKLR